MCGIIGYVGSQECIPIIMDGLKRLEYRGYDSAGVAVLHKGKINIVRSEGKLIRLEAKLSSASLKGTLGLGHTRWATHGSPTERNAHPHRSGDVVVIHNGIIENYLEIKNRLVAEGDTFESDTDTEVIAHLIRYEYDHDAKDLYEAVRRALKQIEGAYAIGVFSLREPDKIIAAKNASPLVIGLGDGEQFLASDIPAILEHTKRMKFLDEGEIAVLSKTGVKITDLKGKEVRREERIINWTASMAEKGGYKHFMLKEIHEQPRALIDTIRGRLKREENDIYLDGVSLTTAQIKKIERILILACGTSYHAGLVGKFIFEQVAKLPVEVDLASEYRYRHPLPEKGTLCIAISQSGETADTITAMKRAKENGARLFAICNVIDSSIARLANDVLYTRAGPEIGVASTKAFTTQIAALIMLAIWFGKRRKALSNEDAQVLVQALLDVPQKMETLLEDEEIVKRISAEYARYHNFLFLGRSFNYPIALEGALKLKEISYSHAEGYPAGEMKHGPIALIDENMPVVMIATQNSAYEKTLGNLQEVRARGGKVIALITAADKTVPPLADAIVEIPPSIELVEPLLTVVPLQLLAYYSADYNGTDIDQPRNLAKSVTVE